MEKFLQSGEAQLVLWSAAGLILLVLAFYLILKFRPVDTDEAPSVSQLIANFRELHSRGDLDDEEFRTIKTKLATRLNEGIRPSDGVKETADES